MINKKTIHIIFITHLLIACTLQRSYVETHITPMAPAPEPLWLSILYPERGQVILMTEYESKIEMFNIASPVCVEISANVLLESGDFWEAKDVIERTVLVVDGIERHQKGRVLDYIVGHLDPTDRDIGGPYAFCVSAPVGVGFHKVDISFETSSGRTLTFSWTFETVKNAIPTPTALPTPQTIDDQGNLPRFLRAVYPKPGQVLSRKKYISIDFEDQNIWGVQPYFSDQQAVCFAFRINELEKLGTLPRDQADLTNRMYFQVDGNLLIDDWLDSTTMLWENSEPIRAHCVSLSINVERHLATLYVDPFDNNMISYSWAFTIIE
jgi:hypothetical protein